MMSAVTCGIRPSIHAAYQARAQEVGVSVTSVYNKLNAMESNVSAEVENALVLLIDLMFLLLRFYPKIKTTKFTP
jgi:hypothetical protein